MASNKNYLSTHRANACTYSWAVLPINSNEKFHIRKEKKKWNKKRSSASSSRPSSCNPSPKGGVLDEPTVALGDEAFAAAWRHLPHNVVVDNARLRRYNGLISPKSYWILLMQISRGIGKVKIFREKKAKIACCTILQTIGC